MTPKVLIENTISNLNLALAKERGMFQVRKKDLSDYLLGSNLSNTTMEDTYAYSFLVLRSAKECEKIAAQISVLETLLLRFD